MLVKGPIQIFIPKVRKKLDITVFFTDFLTEWIIEYLLGIFTSKSNSEWESEMQFFILSFSFYQNECDKKT